MYLFFNHNNCDGSHNNEDCVQISTQMKDGEENDMWKWFYSIKIFVKLTVDKETYIEYC